MSRCRRGLANTLNNHVVLCIFVGVVAGFIIGLWSRQVFIPCIGLSEQHLAQSNSEAHPVYPLADGGAPGMGDYFGEEEVFVDKVPAVPRVDPRNISAQSNRQNNFQTLSLPSQGLPAKKLILIGVMTAKKYLNTRIISSYQTWAKTIPGHVLYFSSEGSEEIALPGLPVIGLKGVDDSYPPQKKSFLMLKYMHDFYKDQYEWFMRADDDLYIKGDDLGKFLRSINSSNPHFIGQAGLGNKDEFGLLSLDKNENFCMGGPGMVLSRVVLEKMADHISYCLKNLYTTHEDVEIGRCIQKFAGTSCTWAFEMQNLFYHNHNEPNGSFTKPLKMKEVHRAITLHPFKNHTYQYRMHSYLHQRRSHDMRHRNLQLQRQVNSMNDLLQDRDAFYSPDKLGFSPSLLKFEPKQRGDVLDWEFLSKRLYSHKTTNPQPGLSSPLKDAFDDIMLQVMQMINKNARQRGRTIDFKEILYGYKRVDPQHGADYILDLLLVYRKHKGRKMTIPVRRHAYLQQAFSPIEFREDEATDDALRPREREAAHAQTSTAQQGFLDLVQEKLNFFKPLAEATQKVLRSPPQTPQWTSRDDKVLHFILTLSGRHETFLRFLGNLDEVCLRHEAKVVLVVVMFSTTDEADQRSQALLREMQLKYPHHSLQSITLPPPFSRGVGLEHGASMFPADALVVFVDVDMYLNRDAVQRLKWNTIQHQQVYYPIVFSQFDPVTYANRSSKQNPFNFANQAGNWRSFGFGIASMYNSDFQQIGGFDKSLKGWGLEDVRLFDKFVKSNLTVFRTAEPGLVHIFHPIFCDPNLGADQYQACLGTKSSNYGSVDSLARMIRRVPALYNRGEYNRQPHADMADGNLGEARGGVGET